MKSYKLLDQSHYQTMELCGVTGINPTNINQLKAKLKIKNESFEKEGRKCKGVTKKDVIKMLLDKGYIRVKTEDGKDLLIRKVIEIR